MVGPSTQRITTLRRNGFIRLTERPTEHPPSPPIDLFPALSSSVVSFSPCRRSVMGRAWRGRCRNPPFLPSFLSAARAVPRRSPKSTEKSSGSTNSSSSRLAMTRAGRRARARGRRCSRTFTSRGSTRRFCFRFVRLTGGVLVPGSVLSRMPVLFSAVSGSLDTLCTWKHLQDESPPPPSGRPTT